MLANTASSMRHFVWLRWCLIATISYCDKQIFKIDLENEGRRTRKH